MDVSKKGNFCMQNTARYGTAAISQGLKRSFTSSSADAYREGDDDDDEEETYESSSEDNFESSSDDDFESSSTLFSSSSTPSSSPAEKTKKEKTKIAAKKPKETKTKGELGLDDLPPVEDLAISVAEEEVQLVGKVSGIVDRLVVVEAAKDLPALNTDSVLFLTPDKPLGRVYETLGPVVTPYYCVRFNSDEEIKEKGVEIDANVYFAPENSDVTTYAVVAEEKGSDASWKNNNEPPADCVEYSDDEEERRARKAKKKSKKHDQNGGAVASTCSAPSPQQGLPFSKSAAVHSQGGTLPKYQGSGHRQQSYIKPASSFGYRPPGSVTRGCQASQQPYAATVATRPAISTNAPCMRATVPLSVGCTVMAQPFVRSTVTPVPFVNIATPPPTIVNLAVPPPPLPSARSFASVPAMPNYFRNMQYRARPPPVSISQQSNSGPVGKSIVQSSLPQFSQSHHVRTPSTLTQSSLAAGVPHSQITKPVFAAAPVFSTVIHAVPHVWQPPLAYPRAQVTPAAPPAPPPIFPPPPHSTHLPSNQLSAPASHPQMPNVRAGVSQMQSNYSQAPVPQHFSTCSPSPPVCSSVPRFFCSSGSSNVFSHQAVRAPLSQKTDHMKMFTSPQPPLFHR